MNRHTIKSASTNRQRIVRLSACVALAALLSAPLWAAPSNNTGEHNARGASGDNISWLSGGIGDEARDEMRRSASSYNVHLVFSTRTGAYLADVPFSVARNGQEVYSGVSDGPLLYLKLKPGSYRISATIDGATQARDIKVAASQQSARLVFVSRAQ